MKAGYPKQAKTEFPLAPCLAWKDQWETGHVDPMTDPHKGRRGGRGTPWGIPVCFLCISLPGWSLTAPLALSGIEKRF